MSPSGSGLLAGLAAWPWTSATGTGAIGVPSLADWLLSHSLWEVSGSDGCAGVGDATSATAIGWAASCGAGAAWASTGAAGTGFTYTVLDPASRDVIGCVYIYPLPDGDDVARARSWVRASHAQLDTPLWRVVSEWLASDWPFASVEYAPRT